MTWSPDPRPVEGTPAAPAARRAPTWVVVAVTAAVLVGFVLSFVVGVVTGFALDDGTATTAGGTPAGGGGGNDADPPSGGGGGGGALDDCVVGSWRTTEHVEDWTTDRGEAELTGLQRTMTFTADGTQTVTYDGAAGTVTAMGSPQEIVFDGEVVYRTSTSGSTMSFELVSAEGTVTVGEKVEDLEPGTGDVTYSCDDTTLRQEAEGYLSVYERTG